MSRDGDLQSPTEQDGDFKSPLTLQGNAPVAILGRQAVRSPYKNKDTIAHDDGIRLIGSCQPFCVSLSF
jgi:hypothetical protein